MLAIAIMIMIMLMVMDVLLPVVELLMEMPMVTINSDTTGADAKVKYLPIRLC